MRSKIYKDKRVRENMKKTVILVLAILVVLLQVSGVLADGAYIPYPDYWVRPGQQKAIIFHEENKETMILTSDFKGNAKELVWIVPTPTIPKLSKANEEIFINIQRLTAPQYDRGSWNVLEAAAGAMKAGGYDGVAIIESQEVDYYNVSVIAATNSEELVRWFNENGYVYPKEYAYVLNYYINKGWFFNAIKVSSSSIDSKEVESDLREGHPTPIKFEFLSDKIVFPLKISSIDFKPEVKYIAAKDEPIGATRKVENSEVLTKKTSNPTEANWCIEYSGGGERCINDEIMDMQIGGINYVAPYWNEYTPIQLYIIAEGKYEANNANFNIQYGNWFEKNQIEKLGDDENGESLIQPSQNKYFITSLYANLQKSQMDDDVFFRAAEDNKKVNAGPEAWESVLKGVVIGFVIFLVWVFTPLGIMFIIGILLLFLSSNRTARGIAWVLEGISLAITLLIGLGILSLGLFGGGLGEVIVLSTLITDLVIVLIMVLFMVLERKYRK